MKTYTPRRSSKQWPINAPSHVLDLFFNRQTGTWDALYCGSLLIKCHRGIYVTGREMSENPFHPQGVGIWFELSAGDAAAYRYRNKKHRVTWDSLPEKVKKCVIQDGR